MLFFDIDDTLTDSYGAHSEAISHLFQTTTATLNNPIAAKQEWQTITDFYLDKYFRKEISLEDQRHSRLIEFWKNQGFQLTKNEAAGLYLQYHQLYLNNCILFTDVKQSLLKLSSFRLGIISNGVDKDQIYKLKNNGILILFSDIIISESVGFAKPQKEIFELAVKRSGLHPEECFYFGNSYTLDYTGAKKAGLNSYWINLLKENYPVQDQFTSLVLAIEHFLDLQKSN